MGDTKITCVQVSILERKLGGHKTKLIQANRIDVLNSNTGRGTEMTGLGKLPLPTDTAVTDVILEYLT